MARCNMYYLVGKTFEFYGVDGNCFKLDSSIYEALEDESDGYRSFLDEIIERRDESNYVFPSLPIAKIKIVETDEMLTDFEGYQFRDIIDNHLWLTIGTDQYDGYYPYFVFSYNPKESNNAE